MNTNADSPGTIESYLLHTVRMGDGSGKPDRVILDGILIAYVGIGWIDLRSHRRRQTCLLCSCASPDRQRSRRDRVGESQGSHVGVDGGDRKLGAV